MTAQASTEASPRIVALSIQGMHCVACVNRAETALRSVSGVQQANINLALERAEVLIDDGIGSELLLSAVENVGFQAQLAQTAMTKPAADDS